MDAAPPLLGGILPPEVVVIETCEDLQTPLYPAELNYIARAFAKRRTEFTTVRGCAQRALCVLGYERPPQVPGVRGEPTWPRGIVGSMTHCAGYRAAAVAPASAFDTIGIDAEPNVPLPDVVRRQVGLPAEVRLCARLAIEYPKVYFDRLLFSIKESVYKAWFPMEGVWLGFEEAYVEIDPEGSFVAHLRTEGEDFRHTGVWACSGATLVSALAVPHRQWRKRPTARWDDGSRST